MLSAPANLCAGSSLLTTITRLAAELTDLKSQLRQARLDVSRLSLMLARTRNRPRPVDPGELEGLRRRVAYYCHPDRGGDGELMSRLNRLFDALQNQSSSEDVR